MIRTLALCLALFAAPAPAADPSHPGRAPVSPASGGDVLAGLAAVGLTALAFRDLARRDDRDVRIRVQGRAHGRALPAACLSRIRTPRGPALVYARGCLRRSLPGRRIAALPGACRLRVVSGAEIRTAYGYRCLARRGWRAVR